MVDGAYGGLPVDPVAATADDYASGNVAGYSAPGGTPTPPDQPALQTDTSQAATPAQNDPGQIAEQPTQPTDIPLMTQADVDKALQAVSARQQKARTEHAQTWSDLVDAPDGVLDPSKTDDVAIQSGPAPDNKHGFWRDFGDRLWGATLESGKDVMGAVTAMQNYVGADPAAIKRTTDFEDLLDKHVKATYDDLSDAGKQALTSSIWDGSAFQNPGRYLSGQIADFAPGAIAAVGAGVGAAALAPEEAAVAGSALVTRYAPQVLGKVLPALLGPRMAASLAGMAVFGSLNAGQTFNTMVDQVRDATPKQLMNVPIYKEAVAQGKSDTEARQDIIHSATAPFVALSGAVGAAAGAGLGATAMGALLPAGASLLKRAIVSAGEGGATMAFQQGGTDAVTQNANISLGQQQEYDPFQTAAAVAQGFGAGVALGGPLGVFHADGSPVKPKAAIPQPVETHTDPAAKAALDTTLKTPAPTPATTTEPDASQTPGAPSQPAPAPATPPAPTAAPAPQAGPASPPAPPASTPPAPPTPPTPPASPAPKGQGTVVRSVQQIMQEDGVPVAQAIQIRAKELQQKVQQERAKEAPQPPSPAPATVQASPQETLPPSAFVPQANAEPVQEMVPPAPPVAPPTMPVGDTAGGAEEVPAAPAMEGNAAAPEAPPSPEAVPPSKAVGEGGAEPPDVGQSPVEQAAAQTEEPKTPEHAENNDYTHGRVEIGGLPISIETPRGAERKGTDPSGKEWSVKMPDHYGYIENTKGKDGDPIDVYLGPKADTATEHDVHIVDQRDPKTGVFDEHKVMLGYDSAEAALKAYHAAFSDGSGPARVGAITSVPFNKFKEWATTTDGKEGFKYQPSKGDLIKYKAKVDREARKIQQEKAVIKAKGETFKRAENVHVDEPTTVEPTPVVKAGPEPVEEAPREDISDVIKEETGDGHEETPEGFSEETTETPTTETVAEEGPKATSQDINLGEKTRADTSTDRKRVADDELTKVEQGLKTIHEAAADFDWTPGKQGGRPPNPEHRTLQNYLEHVIPLTDRDAIEKHIDDLVALMSNKDELMKRVVEERNKGNNTPLGKIRENIQRDLLKQAEELKDQLDTHDRLKGHLEALKNPDPIGDVLRREKGPNVDKVLQNIEKKKRLAEKAEKSKEAPTPQVSYDSLVKKHLAENTNFIDAMKEAHLHDMPYKMADAMRLAARNITGKEFSQYNYTRNMLNHLAGMMPDVPVRTSDYAFAKGVISPSSKNQFDRFMRFGSYHFKTDPSTGEHRVGSEHVVMPSTLPGAGEVSDRTQFMMGPTALLHEGVHALTARATDYAFKVQRGPLFDALRALHNEYVKQINEHSDLADKAMLDQAKYTVDDRKFQELVTQLLTNPEAQKFAAMVKPSQEFINEIKRIGFDKPPSTMWEYFKDILSRVLKLLTPKTKLEESLLDHALAPLQHVVQQGAEYERAVRLLPSGKEGDEQSYASMLRAFGPDVDRVADKAIRWMDLGGVTDRVRAGVLQATTDDALVKKYRTLGGDFGNALGAWRTAKEAINKTISDHFAKYGDTVNDLIKRLQGRDELAALLNDATVAKASLGPRDNAKINKSVLNIQDLRDRYDRLNPTDRETYNKTIDFFKNQYEIRSAAERKSLIDNFLPEATQAQKDMVDDLLKNRSPKEIQNFIDNADTSDIAKMFADKWDRSRAFVTGIADLVKGAKLKGDYFPLRRYGDYVVHYGDSMTAKEDDPLLRYGVEMFEKKSEADARWQELIDAGHANVSDVMTKRESAETMRVDIPFVRKMFGALEESTLNGAQKQEARDLLHSVVLEHATTSEATRIARRKGIQGASKDAARTVAQEHLNLGYRLGYLLHGGDRRNAIEDMSTAVRQMRHVGPNTQIVANAVLHEIEKRSAATGPNTSFMAELGRRATNLGFMQSVASPSMAFIHTADAQSMAVSLLTPRHGGEAVKALGKAMKDLAPRLIKEGAAASFKAARKGLVSADWDMARYGIDQLVKNGADAGQMERLFKPIQDAGLIDHTVEKDIRDIAKGGSYEKGKLSTAWNRFRDLNTIGMHAVDVMNRMSIAKATFDLELAKTGSEGVAIERALDTLRDAMPNYGGKARIATRQGAFGNIAPMVMQFKNYGLHMYSVMGNLLHVSLRSADATERKQAAMALAGIFATHALMAGALGMVGDPLALAGVAYSAFTGNTKPHDFEADLRGFLSDTMGPTMGEIFSRGLPHAFGFDVQHRLGMSNMLELPALDSLDGKGVVKFLGAVMTGASGEDASNMVGGLFKTLHGDLAAGFEAMVPRPLRDPFKAYKLATEGVLTPGGKVGLSPDQISPAGIVGQAFGFQPANVSEYREGRAAVAQAKAEASVEQQHLTQAWVDAADSDARAEAMSAIQQYNASHPGQEIQTPSLYNALRRSRLNATAQPGSFGLQLSPRQAKAMAQAGRFANVN